MFRPSVFLLYCALVEALEESAMVIRYTKDGSPYRVPPYGRAELEEMRSLNNPIVRYFSHRRSAQPPQDQEPPGPPPAGIPPEREQP